MRGSGTRVAIGLGASLLALAGCKQQAAPDRPPTPAQVAEQAAAMPKPLPGLYRSKAELIDISAPDLPPQVAAQMKQAMASRAAPQDFCLTSEEAAKGYEDRVKKLAGRGSCRFDHYAAAAGKLDARMVCTAQGGAGSTIAMQGTMSPEGSDMTLTMAPQGAPGGGGPMPGKGMKLTMHVVSQRVGDCPPG